MQLIITIDVYWWDQNFELIKINVIHLQKSRWMLRCYATGAGQRAARWTANIAWLAISSGASPQHNVLRCALANEHSPKHKILDT